MGKQNYIAYIKIRKRNLLGGGGGGGLVTWVQKVGDYFRFRSMKHYKGVLFLLWMGGVVA